MESNINAIEISLASYEDYQIDHILLEPESICGNHKIYDQASK